jgi:hypothetical protein
MDRHYLATITKTRLQWQWSAELVSLVTHDHRQDRLYCSFFLQTVFRVRTDGPFFANKDETIRFLIF